MIPAVIISKKRDRLELTPEEIRFMVQGFANGTVPDYQMSALAMAIYIQGMTEIEKQTLTREMIQSGDVLPRVSDRPRVDKHSTGGLGDKTSLILAPLLACFELDVPMISGRGLGITGGTLDKLEAIPGFRTNLEIDELGKQLKEIGCCITGATRNLVPADQKLYALRDVTGTVPSTPLITASIMSKKIAETLDALVLDVKWGSAAFKQTLPEAIELAESLVYTGKKFGVDTRAFLTDMTQPLGRMVGNANEVNESLEVLQGLGPSDTRELTIELAASLLVQVRHENSMESARRSLSEKIDRGFAWEKFQQMVAHQGGNISSPLPLAPDSVVHSRQTGFVWGVNGQLLGQAIIAMGGGRTVVGQRIDHGVGLEMLVRVGDPMEMNHPLVRIFARNDQQRETAARVVEQAIEIRLERPEPIPLYSEFVSTRSDASDE